MWKYVLSILAFIVLLRFGYQFILSDKFQEYADRENAQWTCHVNNFIGAVYMFINEYRKAVKIYTPVLERCPESKQSELAQFRIAQSWDKKGYVGLAKQEYIKFLELYPKSIHAPTAQKATEILHIR